MVVQAKRYKGIVPASAVRDLYGTMIDEGASNGILVTTCWFGPKAREWAEGKPLSSGMASTSSTCSRSTTGSKPGSSHPSPGSTPNQTCTQTTSCVPS